MSFHIAPLNLTDRTRWEQLWAEYQLFYGVALTAAVTECTWQRIHDGRVHGLAAREAGGAIHGIVHYLFHGDTWSTAPACYLQDLYVDQKARGRGCARQLIEAVAQCARDAGASEPYWLTHETNATARKLYDRVARNHGFIQYVYASPLQPKGL
jgi:GNAT superfamily N-acetyltransferase